MTRLVRTSQLRVIQRQIESGIEGREGSGIEGREHPHDNPSWYTCKGMDLTPPCLVTISLLETAPSCWMDAGMDQILAHVSGASRFAEHLTMLSPSSCYRKFVVHIVEASSRLVKCSLFGFLFLCAFGLQVELINSDSEDNVEVKYIVTLQQDILSLELEISNSKSSPFQLMGSVISHLTVSMPEAIYAVGLEGSNFFSTPPFLSNFGIIPPDFGQIKDLGSSQLWDQMSLKRFLSSWGARNQNNTDEAESRETEREEEMEGEENDNYKHLTEKMSRIYTSAPRQFRIIDSILVLQKLNSSLLSIYL